MQRLSALARWTATTILIPILIGVATDLIKEQPPETANVVLQFLFWLTEQTWFRRTALFLFGVVVGLWADYLLRKLDRFRTDERRALGTRMLNIGDDLSSASPPSPIVMQISGPSIRSCFTTARKLGIWAPNDRIFSIDPGHAMDLVTDYLMEVGTFLRDGHFSEAKKHARSKKVDFDLA